MVQKSQTTTDHLGCFYMFLKPYKYIMGFSTTNLSWFSRPISEPSTVSLEAVPTPEVSTLLAQREFLRPAAFFLGGGNPTKHQGIIFGTYLTYCRCSDM